MSPSVLSFPAADRQQWQDLVTKVLKGVSADSLSRLDEDDLEILALYQIEYGVVGSPNQVPAHRLNFNPADRLAFGWRVCQPVDADAAPETVNQIILDELTDGATGIYLTVEPLSKTHLEQILHDVVLGAVDIVLDAGNDVGDVLLTFDALSRDQNKKLSDIGLDLAIDPFAPKSNAGLLAEGLQVLGRTDHADIPDTVFRLNGWHWHNQGMSQIQELSYLLATATQIFRSGMDAGLSAAQIASKTSMSVALPADMFDGIAKCRALRRGWAGLVSVLGLDVGSYSLRLHALPSMRMFSLADSNTNILRTTTALLGGAIGGADMMTAFPHDTLTGVSAVGRRLARMQQVMMIEESGLGRTLDPAGGAAFVEARTEALAEAAWASFQDIEAAGGAIVAYADQTFASMARNAALGRDQGLIKGKSELLGLTLQPDSQPVPDIISRWRDISRPAAVIETIRREAEKKPPRILILQHSDIVDPRLEKIRQVLRIGGMSSVHLNLSKLSLDALAAARPSIVVLLDLKIELMDLAVRTQLHNSVLPGGVFEADNILQSEAQIEWMLRLLDITKDAT